MCNICVQMRPFDSGCVLHEFTGTTATPQYGVVSEGRDAPGPGGGSLSTPYAMRPGDAFRGLIDSPGDTDLVAIRLVAGATYTVTLQGQSLSDPVLEIYDARGTYRGGNDDSNGGLDCELTFVAADSGIHYLSAMGYSTRTGSYQLEVTTQSPLRPASVEVLARYLTDGFWADMGRGPHAFDTSRDTVITVNLTALGAQAQVLARDALTAWASVADIRFQVVGGTADIRFTEDQQGAFSQSTTFGSTLASSLVNVDRDLLREGGTAIGSDIFRIYLHEIGHALGLGHMGNYNFEGSYPNNARFANDSWQASVMSYFSQADNTTVAASLAQPVTAMPADILAIQRLYGAAEAGSLTGGNTVYGTGHTLGNSWLGRVFTEQNGVNLPSVVDARQIAMTIWDAGGYDMLNFSRDAQDQRVVLQAGGVSDIFGLAGNLQIASGTVIEGFIAGSGDDVVTGNGVANLIRGQAGNDVLRGGGGNDVLYGGTGNDVLQGGPGNDRLLGEAGHDRITDTGGSNMLWGGAGNDLLTTGAGRDYLAGGAGNDQLRAGAGNDRLFGEDGNDLLQGGAGNDQLRGGSGSDRLLGQAGNDLISGGLGLDILTGGTGADVFLFGAAIDSTLTASDLITDYDDRMDRLDLRALDLSYAGQGNYQGDRSLRWTETGGHTRVLVDVTGDLRPDMLIRLTGLHDLDADSFLL